MIRRFLVSLGLVTLALVVQSTWLDVVAIRSVVPDLALLMLIYISFNSMDAHGQAVGFLAGFLQDGMSAGPLGLHSFMKTAIAWSFNALSGKFYIDRLIMPVLFGFSATILKAVYLGLLSWLFAGKIHAYNIAEPSLWIEVAYNAILAPVVFLLLSPLKRLITGRRDHA
ncbi:MAG: rod shape-determining protein MreD [Spirochaetales bacterium]|nr:MAG: rod shape-determining protein MreD [Spirochaetales bacterium]